MIFLPAHRAFSIDALRSRVAHSATTPVWTLWLLRGQVALVYFYGGVTKLHADCLQGEPMRLRYLAPWQRRVIVNDPDMILQLCRYLKEEKRRQGYADYEVYAHINVSLNGRPPQLMLDPSVDLASQSRALLPAPWIKRLTVPLPAR